MSDRTSDCALVVDPAAVEALVAALVVVPGLVAGQVAGQGHRSVSVLVAGRSVPVLEPWQQGGNPGRGISSHRARDIC